LQVALETRMKNDGEVRVFRLIANSKRRRIG
jgi:hypothetical protein